MDSNSERKNTSLNLKIKQFPKPVYNDDLDNFFRSEPLKPVDTNVNVKLETRLLNEINNGKHEVCFQLGQIYFEKVYN